MTRDSQDEPSRQEPRRLTVLAEIATVAALVIAILGLIVAFLAYRHDAAGGGSSGGGGSSSQGFRDDLGFWAVVIFSATLAGLLYFVFWVLTIDELPCFVISIFLVLFY